MTEDVCTWDRWPGEPILWFSRFEAYRSQGPGRAMLYAYRLISNRPDARKVPGSWTQNVAKWEWKKRILAWDDAEILKERQAARAERFKLLRGG